MEIPERCPSGLRSTLGKRVLGKLNRGFESHPLRHSFVFSGLGSFLKRFPKTSSTSPKTPARAVLGLERTQHHGNFKDTLYKYVKFAGIWRYCKAVYHENGKIKSDIVFVNVKQALLEKHPEGRYYMSHNGGWIDAGTDALEAQRKRKQRLALDEFNRLSKRRRARLGSFA